MRFKLKWTRSLYVVTSVAFILLAVVSLSKSELFAQGGINLTVYVGVPINDPNPRGGAFGLAIAGLGDVNGDAVPDVLVGAPFAYAGGNYWQGQAYVFSGADGSLLLTLDDPNPQADARFGVAVAGVGDINGDVVPDLLVGAYDQDVGDTRNQGQAFVFSGADGSVLRTLDDPDPFPGQSFGGFFGSGVSGAGDVNADGVPDLVVTGSGRAYVFSGADGGLLRTIYNPDSQSGTGLGSAVARVGDANADGIPDLLVAGSERAFVFSGADGALLLTLQDPNPTPFSEFGYSLAGVGDVNGDGVPDMVVGLPNKYPVAHGSGQALVFSGADGSVLLTLNYPDNPDPCSDFRPGDSYFAEAVAGVGDVSGDGVPDILIGAPRTWARCQYQQGQAYVFSGADGSLLHTLDNPNIPNQFDDPAYGPLFGLAVAGVGDVNGDGVPDLLVSAPYENPKGQVVLFRSISLEATQ